MGYKKWTQSASQLKPDTRYNSELISKFINCIMWSGKKSTATRLFYDAMDLIAKRVKDEPPDEVFEKAVNNCRPNVEVRSKRVGGSNYQVPMPEFEAWKTALKGQPKITFRSFPALNHLFIAGKGKSTPAEYQKTGHVDEAVIRTIGDWIIQLDRKSDGK